MPDHSSDVVVAGHICLDIIPSFENGPAALDELIRPGALTVIGPAIIATGGAVSNTGLALHRLGIRTQLMGKIGQDLLGTSILNVLRSHGATLAEGMIVTPDASSSYTVVISPPGIDRVFLHHPGANDTFTAADVPVADLADARLFHFGYPPLMRRFYQGDGRELARLFERVAALGVATSLDMAWCDPASPAGQADWRGILAAALPHVDVFLPSLDEALFMLGRPPADATPARNRAAPAPTVDPNSSRTAAARQSPRDPASHAQLPLDPDTLGDVATELLDMGAAVVGLKLGDHGLYVRTSTDAARFEPLRRMAGNPLDTWVGRELYSPCFAVDVVGTTGCGDCTIAGFLAALLDGGAIGDTLTAAVAVGACAAERADAFSGVPAWPFVAERLAAGWRKHTPSIAGPGWHWHAGRALAHGPHDRG